MAVAQLEHSLGRELTITEKQILYRIGLEKDLKAIREKIHMMRKVTLGDYSDFDEYLEPQLDPTKRQETVDKGQNGASAFRDILVRSFGVGQSNEIGKVVRNMTLKTSFNTPSVEFEDIEEIESAMASTYLQKVFRETNAVEHMRFSVMDFLTGGYGFVWASIMDGEQEIRKLDSLDVIWDPSIDYFPAARWFAVGVSLRLADWVDLFGEEPFEDLLEADATGIAENPLRLIYYYDREGDLGNYAVIRGDLIGTDRDPFVEGPLANPHYVETDGYRRAVLPIIPIHALIMPGANHPTGLVEMMLPHQIQLRIAEKVMMDTALRGSPAILVKEGAVDEITLQELADGRVPPLIKIQDLASLTQWEGLSTPETALRMQANAGAQLVAMGGDDPYASGKTVSGTKFAAESVQIGQAASLVSSAVAQVAAMHWARVAEVVLANAVYHESPFVLRMDGVVMEFGPENPIAPYLVADATAVVNEDTMRFMNQSERLSQASYLLDTALKVAGTGVAPQAVKLAMEKVLRESGEKDVAKWFEQPMVPMMGASGMATDEEVASDVQ